MIAIISALYFSANLAHLAIQLHLRHLRHLCVLLMVAMLAILSACGGGDSSAIVSDTFVAQTAAATLGSSGGTLSLSLTDGTKFEMVIPAGALTTNTALTLTTQPPVAGQRFNLLVKPAGLILAGGANADIFITLPPGQTLPATAGLIYDSVPIPFAVLNDGRIKISLSNFANNSAVTSLAASIRKLAVAVLPNATGKRSMMLAAIAPRNSDPCAGVSSASAPMLSSNGGLSVADITAISLYGECMVATINNLMINEQFAEAVRVAGAVEAYIQLTGTIHSDSNEFRLLAETAACTGYGIALDRARAATVTTMGTLYDLIKPIMFWEMTVQKLGASCPGIGLTDYQSVIAAKTDEAMAYYTVVKPNITDTSSTDYTVARTEASKSVQTQREVLALAPNAALRSTLDAQVTQRAQPGVLDALLQAPWNLCHDRADYSELMNLMLTLDSPDAVMDAAQYCGTLLQAQTKSAIGTVIATLAPNLGGVSASQKRVNAGIAAAKDGKLILTGPIAPLQCPLGYAGGSESLTIKLDGTEIQTGLTPPYLAGALEIDLAAALHTAHPGAATVPTQAIVTLERVGNPCSDFWGVSPAPLLTLGLNFAQKRIVFTGADGNLWTINSDGTGKTDIGVNGIEAAWSHDRSRIAFESGNRISIVNADGSGRVDLTLGSGINGISPSWSPDDRQLVFTQMGAQIPMTLCFMNADGSGVHCLPAGILTQNGNGNTLSSLYPEPAWAPDGTRIAFTGVTFAGAGPPANYHSNLNVFLVNLDGSGLVNLTNNTGQIHASSAVWSPDGTKIAYAKADNSIPAVDIYVMTIAGGGSTRVTTSGNAIYPTWSPDGTRIAYTDFAGNNYQVFVTNADGSGVPVPIADGTDPGW